MQKIISIHSFRGGTGKSNTTANLAAIMARHGKRVAAVDTDIQSPGIHVLFQLGDRPLARVLNDYLWGECDINDAAYDVTEAIQPVNDGGRLFLIPASTSAADIARVLRDGYNVELLSEGFKKIVKDLELDALIIDTHPGLNEETLLSIAISNSLLVVLRPDAQDYLGTSITVEVARELNVPDMMLLVNKVPGGLECEALRTTVEKAYNCPVAGILPHAEEMMTLGSAGLFAVRYPEHPITAELRFIAAQLIA